jgi:hypothetical protein
MAIKWEGLIFGAAAVGWGVWELLALRRANRRARERERAGLN